MSPGPALAVTMYGPPTVPLARIVTDALPPASVVTVMVVVPLLNVPLGPLPGAV